MGSEQFGGDHRLGRREFLVAGAGAGVSAAALLNHGALARAQTLPRATEGAFAFGVASGFPSTNSITLWTRVAELQKSAKIAYEVATDTHFKHVVAAGNASALAARDFTVHQPLSGLKPATEYFYRFSTQRADSRVGRFRTLPPADSMTPLRIGYYSCSSYEAGYYTALAGLAAEKDLDFVICLGDYIYEHHDYKGPPRPVPTTPASTTTATCRRSPSTGRSTASISPTRTSRTMHAAYPFISIWDDHEVENNYAGTHPDSADTDPEPESDGDDPAPGPVR